MINPADDFRVVVVVDLFIPIVCADLIAVVVVDKREMRPPVALTIRTFTHEIVGGVGVCDGCLCTGR